MDPSYAPRSSVARRPIGSSARALFKMISTATWPQGSPSEATCPRRCKGAPRRASFPCNVIDTVEGGRSSGPGRLTVRCVDDEPPEDVEPPDDVVPPEDIVPPDEPDDP